jgi:hypothetical protein
MPRKGVGRAAAFIPFLVAATAAAAAPPHIAKIVFTATGGTFSATVTGTNFGAAPAGVPCTNCAIPEFSFVDGSHLVTPVPYNITAWSNTSITLTGISATGGDAVFATVTNDALKNLGSWGGNLPGKGKKPKITKVAFSGAGANLQITITGTGFGAAPAGIPGTTDVPYLEYLEWNIKHRAQYNYPWGAGWNGQGITDTVTFKYASWTDTQIVVNGFGGAYGTDGFNAIKGDPFVLLLWQTPGIVAGSTGPQTGKGGRVQ